MRSGCCGFMFNLYFDCLIDVSGLGRSWFLKEAPRKTQPTSPSLGGPAQSHGVGGSRDAAEALLPWLRQEGTEKRASNCRVCLGNFPRRGARPKYLNAWEAGHGRGHGQGGQQELCSGLERRRCMFRAALDCESHQRLCEINNSCK